VSAAADPSRIARRAWVLTAVLCLGSLWFRSLKVTYGVALGGALAILNFLWLRSFVETLILKKKGALRKLDVAFYTLKYVITGLIIFLVVKESLVNIFGLLAGLLVVIMVIVSAGLAETYSRS
jgi:hypothetical protein